MFTYQGASSSLTNVVFSGNSAPLGGGMNVNINCFATLTNVTFSGNSAMGFGGLYDAGGGLAQTYGDANARRWWVNWRLFFMVCAEAFGLDEGRSYGVSHYLLEPNPESAG